MPEKKSDFESKMSPTNKCSCCPYGFHIDRDFVRYCDSLYNTAQLDKLRQHKRERRKEKKTVESYLGLGTLSTIGTAGSANIDTSVNSAGLRHIEIFKKTSTLPHDLYLNNDGLKSAMLDFEDTWKKSLKRSSSNSDIIVKRNGIHSISSKPAVPFANEDRELNVYKYKDRSRNSSTSSVSSQSTAISSASVPVTTEMSHSFLSPDNMTSSVTFSSSIESHAVGINRTVLTSIRQRMASSLQRMRELEDQVKAIPVLEVKLYALTQEKKSLLEQLKKSKQSSKIVVKSSDSQSELEKQFKKLENEGVMSPTLIRKCLSSKSREDLASPAIASDLNTTPLKHQYEKETISPLKINSTKTIIVDKSKCFKNASTTCTVLTRDIGIGYVPNKFKSVAVGSDITFKDLIKSYKNKRGFEQFTSVSSESLESDSESIGGSDEHSRSYLQTRFHKRVPHTPSIPIKCLAEASTNTETRCSLNKCVNTEKLLRNEHSEKLTMNKGITASPVVTAKYVQTLDKRTSRNIAVQTSHVSKEESTMNNDKKYIAKRDAAIGDSNVDDILCAACKKVKKSVAVGDFSIKSIICDQCSSLQPRQRLSGSFPVHSGNCENCVLRQTETVGVGDYDINQISCQNCEYVKSENIGKTELHSVGTNTTVEVSSSLGVAKSDIHICDKCSATIQSVAQGFASSNTDSKIPRPSLHVSAASKSINYKLSKLKIEVGKIKKSETVREIHQIPNERKSVSAKSSLSKLSLDQKVFATNASASPSLTQSSHSTTSTDFTNLPALPHKKAELSKEIKAACKVLNDYLQKPERGGEKKTLSSLTMIQNEWFRVANQKKADPLFIEDYIDAFEDFSRVLLQRVVNLSDNNGNSALHYAISYGNFDVVSILIDSKVCDVNKKNKAGYTSIMLVALVDMKNDAHHYVVQRLFSIGDINIKATQNGQTALMLAVSHGKRDIVKILLDAGAEVNLQDKDGSTALMCAAEHGHLEIVKLLLTHPECDPTIVDNDDCNALTIAMEAGHKDIGLLIYTNMNFSRGSSPYSTLKTRKRSTPRSTPPPRTPTLRTPPLPSPSARSTNSIPASFQFPS